MNKLGDGAECFKKILPGMEDATPQEVVGITGGPPAQPIAQVGSQPIAQVGMQGNM